MLISISTAIPLILGGILIVYIAVRGAKRDPPMSIWLGIRTTETLKSDDAWQAGHHAAARMVGIGGVGLILAAGVAALLPADYAMFAALAGAIWVLVFLAVATRWANEAARGAAS